MLNGFKKRFDCSLKNYDDCVFVYQSLHEGCDYGDMNAPVKVTIMTCDEGFDYGEINIFGIYDCAFCTLCTLCALM